jgi:hypothetical protein
MWRVFYMEYRGMYKLLEKERETRCCIVESGNVEEQRRSRERHVWPRSSRERSSAYYIEIC